MSYPRFSDEPVDGYHPGEEQPAMHNDERQKPVTIPASDELIAEMLAGLEGVPAGPWQKMSTPGADDEPMFAIMAQPHPAMRGFTHPIAWAGDPLATHITRCSPENIRALIARTAADGAVEPASDLVEPHRMAWYDDLHAEMAAVEPASLNPLAMGALKNHQRQLDEDGVEVGVSRQALDELIAAYEQAAAALTALQQRAETLERDVAEWKAMNDGWHRRWKAAEAKLASAEQRNREMREALARLITTAALLHQNSVGCATNHYGADLELHGLPGWLADAQKDIEAARAALVSLAQPRFSSW